MRFEVTTDASPAQVLQALTDFTERRPRIWHRTLDPQTYELRELGDTWAVARESTAGSPFWVIERYDWSDPSVVRWGRRRDQLGRPRLGRSAHRSRRRWRQPDRGTVDQRQRYAHARQGIARATPPRSHASRHRVNVAKDAGRVRAGLTHGGRAGFGNVARESAHRLLQRFSVIPAGSTYSRRSCSRRGCVERMLTSAHGATSEFARCVFLPPMTLKRQADLLSSSKCNPSASPSSRGAGRVRDRSAGRSSASTLTIGVISGQRPVMTFTLYAVLAVAADPFLGGIPVGVGWILHAVWELLLLRANVVVWRWYAEACFVIDIVVGGAAIVGGADERIAESRPGHHPPEGRIGRR